MPELLGKSDPSATAGGDDSPVVDEDHALFEVEEVEEVEEEEEEEGSEGEGMEVDEGEEEEVEEEVVEEVEDEEDVGGEGEDEDGEEVEEDGLDREREDVDEVEDEGGDNDGLDTEEVEDEGGDNDGLDTEEVEEVEEEEEEDGDGGEEEIEDEIADAEEEGKGKEGDETHASSAEAATTVQEDAKDLGKMVTSEVHDRDQNSLSSAIRDWSDEKHHGRDPSNIISTYNKELNGETCKGIELEKGISNDAPEHVKNVCLETHGNHLSLGSDNVRSVQLTKNDLVVDGDTRNEPEIVKYDVSEKVESHLHGETDAQMFENPALTCSLTPQRRPRSFSPDSETDKMNKRLASICVFYARGWCIKGKSCKFLHEKDGDSITELQIKEDKAGYRTTGFEEIVEGSKQASAPLDSNPEGALGRNSLLQRALVRTYGTGSHVSSHLHDRYDMQTKGEFRKPDHFQAGCSSVQDEFRKPFGKSYFESVLESQADDAFLSKRHLIEGKIVNEVPRDYSPYNTMISRKAHLVDAFVPESEHYSDNSSIASILHHNSNSSSAYGRTEGSAIRNANSHFTNQESYSSHSLSGPLNSGLSGPFQPSQLDYRLSRAEKVPNFGSTHNSEYLAGHSLLDIDRRHRQDYSPDHSQSALRNVIHHDIPGDLTSRQAKVQYNSWEPSQPFRPFLGIGTKSLSSPASQYDPILDSIEPSSINARDYSFSTSQKTSFQDAPFYPTKTESAIPWEGTLAKNVHLHDSNAHTADVFFASGKLDGGNSSLPNYEKVWNPDVLIEKSNIKDAELGIEWRNLDKSRNTKESKAYRIFHSALVDFVKDLLKPYWRDGQVSKDSHKTIVKKSVEKVLSALQSHQVPSTQEAINQYLAASKPKLLKLVEGYVHKHANP